MTVRNLAQYPLTSEEINTTLLQLAKDLEGLNLCGDIRPLVLKAAAGAFRPYDQPLDTPQQMADYFMFRGRQCGKTDTLIRNLPEGKSVVIVHSHAFGKWLKGFAKEVNPKAKPVFIVWNKGAGMKLCGLRCPIYFDNAVLDIESLRLVRMTNKVYGPNGVNYNEA